MMSHILRLHFALLLGVFCALTAFGQGTGTIHGTVVDSSGAAVSGEQVTATLTGRGTTRSVVSGVQGAYATPLLPVDAHQLTVEAKGSKTFVQRGVELDSNENSRVDATLQVGSLNESVTVNAEAPLVDSRSSV